MDIPLKYKQLWSNWDVRVFILLSLCIQIVLIFLGRMRRTFNSRWIRMIVWCCYLLADSVAIFVLGQLSNNMHDSSSSNAIIAFWAPFLILHLGGPDTITAYSVEDNELWARHLLWLIYHLSIAFYVLFCSIPNTRLLAPTLLIFLVSIIKYLERSYSLYIASIKGFGNSINKSIASSTSKDLDILSKAYLIYNLNKAVFIDALPDHSDYMKVKKITLESEDVLKVMSLVQNYAYDEFYTKAIIIHSRAGYVLRILCSISIALAFYLFFRATKDDFKHVDVAITYVLLFASICLDLVAMIMLVFSNRMVTFLNAEKNFKCRVLFAKIIEIIKSAFHKRNYRMRKMPQLNLFINTIRILKSMKIKSNGENEAFQKKIMNWVVELLRLFQGIIVFKPWPAGSLETWHFEAMQPIQPTDEFMGIITSCLKLRCINLAEQELSKSTSFFAFQQIRSIDQQDVQKYVHLFAGLSLDEQVSVWHITTELCLHQPMIEGVEIKQREQNKIRSDMEACRLLSNYMMYMVVNQSDMRGESSIVFRQLFKDMVEHFGRGIDLLNVEELCKKIMNTPCNPQNLWKILQLLAGLMFIISEEEKWTLMKMIWVELLIRLAKKSKASWHVKQLSKGNDDFLTLIWLFHKNAEMDSHNMMFPSVKIDVSDDQIKVAEDLLLVIKPNIFIDSIV